jgi:SAM-dependent methyltransferase
MSGNEGAIRRARQARWADKVGSEACWYISEPPPELANLLRAWPAERSGSALDVGCGPGTITGFLADHFTPAVGFDVAIGAIREARSTGAGRRVPPAFVVAEAPWFPFGDERFDLIFDRGVLHHIKRDRWPGYFREIARMLRPNGVYLQYCPQRPFPAIVSYRGLRARAAAHLRPKPSPEQAMRHAAPNSLAIEDIHPFPFSGRNGKSMVFTYGLFRKKSPAEA